jgi:hypothetical protein
MSTRITIETDDATARELAEVIGEVMSRRHAYDPSLVRAKPRQRLRLVKPDEPVVPGMTAGGDRR